ncbi:MAG: DNA-processing protein DprA [Anaerolineales bacterium]|nr:DNA-processing protein DprA [Anaerolineales bacterium]
MGDARYYIGFSYARGIGSVRLRMLLAAFGDMQSAWTASEAALASAGLGPSLVQSILEARARIDLDEEMARLEARGLRAVTWEDVDYPRRLAEIDAPPPVLYLRGGLREQDDLAVAVVGTRRPSAYGQQVTRDVVSALVAGGVTVVSGLARGIDGIAHETALQSGGRTIAVLGSGMDCIYPPEHRRLAEAVAERGALLTEYPLGRSPEPANFPARNRLISGLSLAVVVAEAGSSSGALITAGFAAEQGREVFAAPGNIYSRTSGGANRLIASGARLLLSPTDVLEALNLELIVTETGGEPAPASEGERRVLKALSGEPTHVDEISRSCELPASVVASCLTLLELRGRVRSLGGMRYVLARESHMDYRVE